MSRSPAERGDSWALAACLGSLGFWSVGPIFIKLLTDHLDGWTQNAVRYTVACLFWLPWLALQGRRGRLPADLWKRALAPTGANVLMQSLWALGFYYADPGLITLITKTNVLWIAVLSFWLFPEERPLLRRPSFWLGLILALTGVGGVLLSGRDHSIVATRSWAGWVIPLGSALFGAAYTVSVRASFRRIDARQGFAVVSLYTTAVMWILSPLCGRPAACLTLGGREWAYVVVSGVTAIALGHVLFYAAVRHLGATLPPLIILAQPLLVLMISRWVFHEHLTAIQLGFGVVLLAGAACAIWTQRHLVRS